MNKYVQGEREENRLVEQDKFEQGYIIKEQCLNKFVFIIDFVMSKGKSEAKQLCDLHIFRLEPKSSDCYYQDAIKVKFCGFCEKTGNSSTKKSYEGPLFNKDRVASTPAFILKSEKDKFKISASFVDNENEQKYFQVTQQKSQMVTLIFQPQLIPKPSSKSFYCNVCKQKYQDYLEHIQTQRHRTKISNNPFNKHIIKISTKYEKERNFKDNKQKQKSHQNQTTQAENIIIIDQDSVEELSKPRKKVKAEGSARLRHQVNLHQQRMEVENYCRFQQQVLLVDYLRSMQQYMNPMNPLNQFMNYPCYPPMMPMMKMPDIHQRNYDSLNKFYGQFPMPVPMPPCQSNIGRRAERPRAPANNMQVILIQDDL